MVLYRNATEKDIAGIATLHAKSWQENYRDALSDDFLDNKALNERMEVWRDRLQKADAQKQIIVTESNSVIIGFVCVFFEHDEFYGSLLDNLHVHSKSKGQGIGTRLMFLAADAVNRRHADSGMYLWVLDQNLDAIRFYENLGGEKIETVKEIDIGDRPVVKLRYYWKSVRPLLKNQPRKKV